MKCDSCGHKWDAAIAVNCPVCGSPFVGAASPGFVGYLIGFLAIMGVIYVFVELIF